MKSDVPEVVGGGMRGLRGHFVKSVPMVKTRTCNGSSTVRISETGPTRGTDLTGRRSRRVRTKTSTF